MTIIEQRNQAVAKTVDRVRLIEQQHGVNYEALGKIRNELIELTRDKELFPRSSFPINDDGGSAVYRISEDSDHRYALYASVGAAGKSVPPHNHTTWAVIVGVYGDELNRFYERTDDASKEGYAELKKQGVLSFSTAMVLFFCRTIFMLFRLMIQNPQCICICMGSPWITCMKDWCSIKQGKQ